MTSGINGSNGTIHTNAALFWDVDKNGKTVLKRSKPMTFHGHELPFDDPIEEKDPVYLVRSDTDVDQFNADAAKLDKWAVLGRLFRGEYRKS